MKKNLLLSLLTGLILALAFPPLKFGFLAYVALIPLFYLLEDKSLKQSFRWGYVAGLFLNLLTIYWVSWVTLPGAIAAILFLPLYLSLYCILHSFLRERLGSKFVYTIPFLWTGVEYLKSLGQLGFPWTSLGYTQTSYLSLIQYDSFTSVYGVSFWVATLNVIFFQITKNWKNTKKCLALILLVLVLFLLPWIYGKKVIPKEGQYQEKIRIALIQGNIDPYVKWDENFRDLNFKTYHRLTEAAALQRPDLLVWPETATPCYLRYDFKYLEQVQSLVDELGIPLLTGSPDFEYISSNMYHTYNSALLLLPNQSQIQSYAKLHLVPFGERVPFEDSFPFSYLKSLLDKLELGQGDFSPGKETVVFQFQTQGEKGSTESIKFSVVICYESIFPELVREFVVKGAQFLIIITNDAWFGKTSAPYHHAQIAIFRAIENRISIGRCANTGVSMFIDSYGRTLMASPIFKEEVLVSDIPLRQEKTFFTRYGNVFSSAILVFNVFPLGLALLHKRTAGPGCN